MRASMGFVTLAALTFSFSAEAKDVLTPELALKVRWPGRPSFAPHGRWLVFTVKDVSFENDKAETHLWLLELASGQLRQLTRSGTSNGEPAWAPDGQRLAFTSNRDGKSQVYLLDLSRGGEAEKLTDLSTGASGAIWSRDGKRLAFASRVYPDCADDACNNKRLEEEKKKSTSMKVYDDLFYRHWDSWDDGRRSHLFVLEVGSGAPAKDVTTGQVAVPTDVLNAGRGYDFVGSNLLVFTANVDPARGRSTNNDLYTVPVTGGAPRKLTSNPAWDANPVASPDGSSIAYVAFARPGFEADEGELLIRDARTGKDLRRTDSFDRSVSEMAWMPGGQGLYFTAYDRGYKTIWSVGRDAGEPTALVEKVHAGDLTVGPKGELVFVSSTFSEPPELHLWDPGSKKVRRLTTLNVAYAEKLSLGRFEELTAKSADGTAVHGFVVYPPGLARGQKAPLLMLIHGGPQGAWTSTWHPRWQPQLFAARGFAVAMPNFRGSVGYGQKFVDAVTQNWGGGPYEDVMAFTEAASALPSVDGTRACAAGASYGGYMVNWIAGHSQRFDCLISHAGVFNLESMWGDTEELWFPEWELGGTPWTARERYERWSPHRHIQAAKTPTLVIHGQLDYRVHLSQGQQMFTALRRLDVPARFVYFEDEGHWVLRPKNFVPWYGEMLDWAERWTKPARPTRAPGHTIRGR